MSQPNGHERAGAPPPPSFLSTLTKTWNTMTKAQKVESVTAASLLAASYACLSETIAATPAPTAVSTETAMPSPMPPESESYIRINGIRTTAIELAKLTNYPVIDSQAANLQQDEQQIIDDFQQVQDKALGNHMVGSDVVNIDSTQIIRAEATSESGQKTTVDYAFNTLNFTRDGVPNEKAITFQYRHNNGEIHTATLDILGETPVDGKIVKTFKAVPNNRIDPFFPAVIAVYDNASSTTPRELYLYEKHGDDSSLTILKGDASNVGKYIKVNAKIVITPTEQAPAYPTIPGTNVPLPTDPAYQQAHPEIKALFDTNGTNSPVAEFAGAFGVKPEEIGDLTPQPITGFDGKQYYVLVTGDLPSTANFNESGTPLFLAQQNEEGEWVWNKMTLKDIKTIYGIDMGGTMTYLDSKPVELTTVMVEQFTIQWTENLLKWEKIEPLQGQLDTKRMAKVKSEEIKMLMKKYGMTIVGHSIVNWDSYPDYIKNENDPEKLLQMMRDHITLLMGSFPEIDTWEVVNEYHDGNYNPDHLRDKVGEKYVFEAFRAARAANPKAKLLLADNVLPDPELIRKLKEEGLINGISIHCHLDQKGIPQNYEETLPEYGLPIYLSEVDINIKDLPETDPDRLFKQASIGESLGNLCRKLGKACAALNQWAVGDPYSWYVNGGAPKERQSPIADATFFDKELRPKPSFYGLMKGLVQLGQS